MEEEWEKELIDSEQAAAWRNVSTWIIEGILQTDRSRADVGYAGRAELAQRFSERMACALTSPDLKLWVSSNFLTDIERRLVSEVPLVDFGLGSRPTIVVSTASTRMAILLNGPLIVMYPFFLQSFFGFYFWETDEPFSRDHLQGEFARSLVVMGQAVYGGRVEDLAPVKDFLYCPTSPSDNTIRKLTHIMQAFLLLREYGLVAKDGMAERTWSRMEIAGRKVEAYCRSDSGNSEADRLAFEKIVEISGYLGNDGSEVALSIGLLFKFLDLCAVRSPMGSQEQQGLRKRWTDLQGMVKLGSGSIAGQLDVAFSEIHRRLLSSS